MTLGGEQPPVDVERLQWVATQGLLPEATREDVAAARLAIAGLTHTARACMAENQRLREQAVTNPVSGLPNKWALINKDNEQHNGSQHDHVSQLPAERHERADQPPQPTGWACLYADLDHFKRVNDVLGHDRGDEVLRVVGSVMRHTFRSYDEVYHISGDEFVIYLPFYASNEEERGRIAEELIRRYGTNMRCVSEASCLKLLPKGMVLTALSREALKVVSTSFGVHFIDGPAIKRLETLTQAEVAMRAVKAERGER